MAIAAFRDLWLYRAMPKEADLLTRGDFRGIAKALAETSSLRHAERVADKLWLNRGTIIIATGFFVRGRPETDGPIGAAALARALTATHARVVLVSRADCLRLLEGICDFEVTLAEFPVQNAARSAAHAKRILQKFNPLALVAIEACGPNRFGRYWNMRGHDISKTTPRMDLLFSLALKQGRYTVGIGDGGNEIGFGNVPAAFLKKLGVEPCLTRTTDLVTAAISNWGAYALVYQLSRLAGRDLLPGLRAERARIRSLVAKGAVDGPSARPIAKVDGRSLEQHEWLLRQLRGDLKRR